MMLNSPIRLCLTSTDVLADLRNVGAALIDEVPGPGELVDLALSLGVVAPHRDSGPDGVTSIEDRGAQIAAMAGFTRTELSPHTDRSGVERPPILLLTACGREPRSGGDFEGPRLMYRVIANPPPGTVPAGFQEEDVVPSTERSLDPAGRSLS